MLVDLLVQYQVAITAFVGAAIGTGILWKRFLGPMAKLMQAQLTENGGGSLVDKVNRLVIQAPANHKAAEEHWSKLEAAQAKIASELAASKAEGDNFHTATDSRIARLEAVIIEGRVSWTRQE